MRPGVLSTEIPALVANKWNLWSAQACLQDEFESAVGLMCDQNRTTVASG